MKKIILLVVAVFFTVTLFAENVDQNKVQKIAKAFAAQRDRSAAQLQTDIVYSHPMPNKRDAAFYVVNIENSGFVIVSANDVAHPVIGYSFDRPWPTEGNIPPQITDYLDDLANQIEHAVGSNHHSPDRGIQTEWQELLAINPNNPPQPKGNRTQVGPLLTTTWDQGQYYNNMTPETGNGHAVTGCVATAMAQIIKYHGYPTSGRGTHSYDSNYGTLSVNFAESNYDYANMPDALTNESSDAQVNAVSKLISDCGVAVNMGYTSGESSAYDQEARAALINFFKYSPNMSFAEKSFFSTEEWNTMLQTELNASRPVYYSGRGTGGHAFVCDGYNTDGYYHFNFGWSGAGNDSWYLLNAVEPLGMNFNSEQSAILGIAPDPNGNVILGQMQGTSTFTVDEPLEFYHLMGHNQYEGNNYTNPCNNTVTFVSADDETQLVADIIEFEDQNILVYDGSTTSVLLRELHGGSENDLSPVVTTDNAVTLDYSGNLYNAGFKLSISQNSDCRMVSNILASVDITTVHLAWTENGTSTQWQVEYGEEGFTHGDGTLITANTTMLDIVFPQVLTKYDIYIRSVCGDNSYGLWAKTTVFSEAPYWQDIVTEQPETFVFDELNSCAIISCAEDFVWYTKCYATNANINARIVNDIDLTGYKWKPVNWFHGSIKGEGHLITNMYIKEVESHTALFSYCVGTISDLGIENSRVYGRTGTGALCGELNGLGSIVNCHVSNSVIDGTDIVGGLSAHNYGTIINSYVNVSISGNRWTGLFNGDSRGTIINCYAAGSIKLRSYCYYAGISAYAASGKIKNCYSVDLPMGVIGFKGMTEISDTSSFYKDGVQWTLRTQISFEDGLETDLLAALNKEVVQLNDSDIRTWTADSNMSDGLPIFGDYYVVQCPNIASLTVHNIKQGNTTGVVVDWEETGDASVWEIKYQPKNNENGSAVIVTTNNKPHTLYNLQLAQEYTFSVRSVCDSENHSGWVSQDVMVDLPFWTDIVTEQPDGFLCDPDGNVSISSAEGLAWLAVLVNGFHGNEAQTFEGKTISLISDINLQGYRWYPIGRGWYSNTNYYTCFNGAFYGNGHAISGMYVNDWGHLLGLFGYAGYDSQETSFHDVALTDGLVNCYNNDSDGGGYGGLLGAGVEVKEIIDCSSNITVKGIMEVGSLCGHLFDQEGVPTIVSNCYATGDVYGREATAGLIGDARGIIVQNCYATGNVYLHPGVWNPWYRGGLIGNFMSNAVVRNCYSTGFVEIDENCSWYGAVIGCPYMNSYTQYVYGLLDEEIPLTGPSSSGDIIIDTSSFCNLNGQQVLITPISLNGITYDNLLDVLNAWVTEINDPMLKTWSADTLNVNGGYPVFGDNYEPSCYNPTNVSITNATIVGDTIIRTRFEWEQEGNPTGWEIKYVIPTQNVDSGTIISVNSNPCVITNIPVGQLLDFYVRAKGDDDEVSGWSNAVRYIPDRLRWTEVVTTQPSGYSVVNNEDVYISSAEGFAWLASVLNKLNGNTETFNPRQIILTSDIDLSAYRWTALGEKNSNNLADFVSECFIEGNNHTISGLYCNENQNRQGLFAGINMCTLQNIIMNDVLIHGLNHVGGITSLAYYSNIINCSVNGNVIGVSYVGGIVGTCVGNVKIENVAFVGMADSRTDVSLPNSYNGFVGGISGRNDGTELKNAYVATEIADSPYSGIVAGSGSGSGLFSEVYALSYPSLLPMTCDNLETNSSFFSGNGNTWTLKSPPYVNGTYRTDLLDALNAWVDANNTNGEYRHWAADTAMVNGGFPILEVPTYYTITASANPEEGGTVSGAGDYLEGATATLTATANTGYTFIDWTLNGVSVSNNPSFTITVTEAANYVANFELNSYQITATANPTSGGTVSGSGTYNYGENCTLTVSLNENFTFINWTENGVEISTDEAYTFVVTENRNIVANLLNHEGVGESAAVINSLYPNPVSHTLTVETARPVDNLEILTINGKVVYTQTNCGEKMVIQVSEFASGTYILKITSGKQITTQQFLKE